MIVKPFGETLRPTSVAHAVDSVGPTTASKLLVELRDTEKEFFNDVFEAKLRSMTTRPYWNEPTSKPKLY